MHLEYHHKLSAYTAEHQAISIGPRIPLFASTLVSAEVREDGSQSTFQGKATGPHPMVTPTLPNWDLRTERHHE